MKKTILILAKSYKKNGWCIAGREVQLNNDTGMVELAGGWIRPVSTDIGNLRTLSQQDCLLEDGTEAKVFDVVEIDFVSGQPEPGQPENYLINGSRWKWLCGITGKGIQELSENPNDIWLDAHSGASDCITHHYALSGAVSQSLFMIQPTNLQVHLSNNFHDYSGQFKREMRISFEYNGNRYENISVTDPKIRRMLGRQYPEEGGDEITMPLRAGDNVLLCLSLSPNLEGMDRHYKLAATICDMDGYIQGNY